MMVFSTREAKIGDGAQFQERQEKTRVFCMNFVGSEG